MSKLGDKFPIQEAVCESPTQFAKLRYLYDIDKWGYWGDVKTVTHKWTSGIYVTTSCLDKNALILFHIDLGSQCNNEEIFEQCFKYIKNNYLTTSLDYNGATYWGDIFTAHNFIKGKMGHIYGLMHLKDNIAFTATIGCGNIPITFKDAGAHTDYIVVNDCQTPLGYYGSRDWILDIFNKLSTITTTKTLTLGATLLAKLTDEDKKIATDKGWTLA